MATAAGLSGVYFGRSDEVCEQKLYPWKRARLRFQQHHRDGGNRAGLCAVVCSTSGRSNQFARKKVKGTALKAVDRPSKKDVHLVEELQNFIAEHDLPSNQLPSIKELTSKGRLDLANVVRSRGYKAVSRMLAHPKVPGGTMSSSSGSDSEVAVGDILRAADVALECKAMGEAAAPGPAGDLEAFASKRDEGDGCSEDHVGSTGTVTGGHTDFVPAVQEDGTIVRGQFTNVQPDSTLSQEDEQGDILVHPQEAVGMLEERLARLTEAVTELSLHERAKMFVKTGEPSLLQESPTSDPVNGFSKPETAIQDVGKSAGQRRMREMPEISTAADHVRSPKDSNYGSAELPDLVSDDELLDSDVDDTESEDEFLEGTDYESWETAAVQAPASTKKDANGAVSNDTESYSVAALEREESIAAQQEMEQVLSILAKQREIGRLMQRDKELDAQFLVDAQVELDKIKSVLQSREAKAATLRQALLEAKAELSLVKAKAHADMEEAARMLAEKDTLLEGAQLALVRLKKISLEWWGEGTKVELAGSFNGWQHFFAFEPDLSSEIPNFDGTRGPMLWCLDMWLYPGVYEIKFMIDGIWTLDHRREMVMRNPNMQNNLLRVDC